MKQNIKRSEEQNFFSSCDISVNPYRGRAELRFRRVSNAGQLRTTVMAGGVSFTGTFIRKRWPSAAGT